MNAQPSIGDTVGVVPTSVGALLAEEWTINPYSTFPSFLEMIWIGEADDSMHNALASGLEQVKASINQQLLQLERHPTLLDGSSTSDSVTNNAQADVWNRFFRYLKVSLGSLQRKSLVILNKMLSTYQLEIAAIIWYIVERESLVRTKACVAESMYGGHRSRIFHQQTTATSKSTMNQTMRLESLQKTDITRIALMKALIPYFHKKLTQLVGRVRNLLHLEASLDSSSKEQSLFKMLRHTGKSWLVFLYPFLRATTQGMNLLCHWRFLMGHSLSFDLPSFLLGQVVRRVTVQDKQLSAEAPGMTGKRDSAPTQSSPSPENMPLLKGTLLWGTSFAVLLSWVTWMKAEWQRASREQQLCLSSSAENNFGPIPPPPKRNGKRVEKGSCPLCQARPPVLATACTVSGGLVFCQDCITRYVSLHKLCPITGRPCSDKHLVRLYEPRVHPNLQPTVG